MPTQYIGRHSLFKGKSLFEIALNFKNFGVGRVVYRVAFMERYKEPSYYRLTKVVPDMTSEFRHLGEVHGERVFRGVNFGECKIESGYKWDWLLVSKDQEESFCLSSPKTAELRTVPRVKQFPPTMELYMKQLSKEEGLEVPEKILIRSRICKNGRNQNYTLAEET